MSRSIFQQSIAATLGVAIVSTGLLASLTSQAQTPVPTTAPTTLPSTVPSTAPAGGNIVKPGTITAPGDVVKPGGTMTSPAGGVKPATGTNGSTKPAKKIATKSIVELATTNKSFTVLVKALKAADLVDTLSGEGPFTVFAPTNEAFAKLPKGTLANLLKPENQEQLKKILTYHVSPGVVTAQMLKAGKIDTVEGSKITVNIRKGKKSPIVRVNNAMIKAGAKATNGMIYAIDTVIMPPTK